MHTAMTQQQAYELLKQYNKDPFHLRHARTVEGTICKGTGLWRRGRFLGHCGTSA